MEGGFIRFFCLLSWKNWASIPREKPRIGCHSSFSVESSGSCNCFVALGVGGGGEKGLFFIFIFGGVPLFAYLSDTWNIFSNDEMMKNASF